MKISWPFVSPPNPSQGAVQKVLVMAGLTRHPLKVVKDQYSKFRNIIINSYQGIAGQARNDREIDFKNNYKLLNNKNNENETIINFYLCYVRDEYLRAGYYRQACRTAQRGNTGFIAGRVAESGLIIASC
jgi:hypothetical protein